MLEQIPDFSQRTPGAQTCTDTLQIAPALRHGRLLQLVVSCALPAGHGGMGEALWIKKLSGGLLN